jgi:hypothetical protein
MTRPEHLKASHLSVAGVATVLDAVAAVAEPVTFAYLWRPILPDADDDMVLETAVDGRADALATFHRRDFAGMAAQFGIPALLPGEAVERSGVTR